MTMRILYTALAVAIGLLAFALHFHWFAGDPACRGDYPKVVIFHQGMTLCPGQSATFTLGTTTDDLKEQSK